MAQYGKENWERFQRSGVEQEDIKIMKKETVEDAFEDTREDFGHLVEKLADGIKEKRWTAILGDDVSGRLPALIIGKLTARYAQEHQMQAPKCLFFAGGGVPFEDILQSKEGRDIFKEKQQKLEEYIHEQSKNLGARVLIVTEHIVGGRTLRSISKALHAEGISFDVGSLWSTKQASVYRSMLEDEEDDFETRFYIGQENAGASSPFGSEVSGLLYSLGVPLNEATGIKKAGTEPVGKLYKEADRDLIKLARRIVDEFVADLYLKHLK